MKVSLESQYNCVAQHMEVLPGVQNSGVMSLRDHSTFLEEKKWLCLDFFEQSETSILQGFSNLFRNSDTKNEALPGYPVRIWDFKSQELLD